MTANTFKWASLPPTSTPSTVAVSTDISRFPREVAKTRPATRLAFETFACAYNRAAQEQNALPLLDVVQCLVFVENPLDVLDLLRSDDEARLIRETVTSFQCDEHSGDEVVLHFLELRGWDWSILVVAGPEAVELVGPRLVGVDGAPTTFGRVERFSL